MIPFGSQRASGQELATHLLNAHDNERIVIAGLRGADADDLHGAFAQWRALARERTRCRKYLYSLSINPDPAQGKLTRAQYADYIARVENKLGLTDQPRAVVFHVKPDKDGKAREHCHVVWSRVIAEQRRAVQISFDREKLMAVTREFARDHGLRLPEGYHRKAGEPPRQDQLTLYEKVQEGRTGLTKEERTAEVTAAWQHSDNAKAFVRALEELGYILTTGKRPYVLVDLYGEMNALPKLIAGSSNGERVRSKDVRGFLEEDFPPEGLPTVEQARALAAQRRKAREDVAKAQERKDDLSSDPSAEASSAEDDDHDDAGRLKAIQAARRQALEKAAAALTVQHAAEHWHLAARHQDEMFALEGAFRDQIERITREREARRPTGLAAFLGRVTGMSVLIKTLARRKDRRLHVRHLTRRARLTRQHEEERQAQGSRQLRQRRAMARRFRALGKIERREGRSLETAWRRQLRIRAREAAAPQPMPWEPDWQSMLQCAFTRAADHEDKHNRLTGAFIRACHDDDDEDEEGDADASGRFDGRLIPWLAVLLGAASSRTRQDDADEETRFWERMEELDSEDDEDDRDAEPFWLVFYDEFTGAAEGDEEDHPPDWLRDLLGEDYAYGDDEDDDDFASYFWTLTDEFMRAAAPAGGKAGSGGGRSPELDEDEDYDIDHEPPPPRPKPKPKGPGRR